jgi:hypothetical protein
LLIISLSLVAVLVVADLPLVVTVLALAVLAV